MTRKIQPLQPSQLCKKTDIRHLQFKTTDDLQTEVKFVGQSRAVEALQFGMSMKKDGYNLYAMGPSEIGKRAVVYTTLESEARHQKVPPEWCYIHNFFDSQKPIAIKLPAGWGGFLRKDMEALVEEFFTSIPIIFESAAYRRQMKKISSMMHARQEKLLNEIRNEAEKKGLIIVTSTDEFTILPADQNGRAISAEHFAKLAKKNRVKKEELISEFTERLTEFLKHIPYLQREQREKEKALRKKFTLVAVGHLIDDLKQKYKKFKAVVRYLEAVQEDVIENVQDFLKRDENVQSPSQNIEKISFTRYQINVLVDHTKTKGAPIIYEENPSYANLICKIEHVAQYGTLSTDFTLIKAGALHKANGGYLIIDAARLLQDELAWDGLKRALHSRKITLETPEPTGGTLSTVSLEPMPIRLNVKVILLGERLLQYLLSEADPDFNELFKVAVDFDDYVVRTPENLQLYAHYVATLANNEKLRPFDRSAVAAVIDHTARIAEDTIKLSAHTRCIHDLICEADHWARKDKAYIVHVTHVKRAIEAKIRRLDRGRESLYEDILRGIILIDLQGHKIGQLNGLMILQLGSFHFGHPCRITARVSVGEGQVMDIQRETEMGGAIHSKGVLILAGFLAARYLPNASLSLSASLVFEQTYGLVDGDSASAGELCALLSAIAEIPIQQSLAVTGSLNQQGEIQAVGGVNEKIEGFFDVCKAQGLTGGQGVIIPASNSQHLMLKDEVVTAVANKKFRIYAVKTIDEVLTLLSGISAGERGKNGKFPVGSVNGKIEKRLMKFKELKDDLKKKRR